MVIAESKLANKPGQGDTWIFVLQSNQQFLGELSWEPEVHRPLRQLAQNLSDA